MSFLCTQQRFYVKRLDEPERLTPSGDSAPADLQHFPLMCLSLLMTRSEQEVRKASAAQAASVHRRHVHLKESQETRTCGTSRSLQLVSLCAD